MGDERLAGGLMSRTSRPWRFAVAMSAGQQGDRRFAVIDRHDQQGGKGARRVSWWHTAKQAQADAKRRNAALTPGKES